MLKTGEIKVSSSTLLSRYYPLSNEQTSPFIC